MICLSKCSPLIISSALILYKRPVSKLFQLGVSFQDKHKVLLVNQSFSVPILFTSSFSSQIVADHNPVLTKDEETLKRMELLLLEYEYCKQLEPLLPDKLPQKYISALLEMELYGQRIKYFMNYVRKTELSIRNKQLRKAANQIRLQQFQLEQSSTINTDHMRYGLKFNTMHFRLRKSACRAFYAHRLLQAAKFGQPLVIDLDYDEHMNRHECENAASQLQYIYSTNLIHREPFDLHFCNFKKGPKGYSTKEDFAKHMPDLFESLITTTESCYSTIFPDKDKFIYLSPNAKEVMDTFDHDAIYIIGGLVDLSTTVRYTLVKAKKEGIRVQKLPVDKYVLFKSGACKSFPMFHVVKILLEVKSSGDWKKAFLEVLPKRAIKPSEEIVTRGKWPHSSPSKSEAPIARLKIK